MMRGRDILREIMGRRRIGNAELASRLGITPAAAWERVNNKNVKDIPAGLLAEMADAMDYKVIVVHRSFKAPADSYEVN